MSLQQVQTSYKYWISIIAGYCSYLHCHQLDSMALLQVLFCSTVVFVLSGYPIVGVAVVALVAMSMQYVARIWSIARLTKRCAADQFINCAAFDELRIFWSVAQRTCSRVRVIVKARIRVRARVKIRIMVCFRVRVRLGFGLGSRNWPNTHRVCRKRSTFHITCTLAKCAYHR